MTRVVIVDYGTGNTSSIGRVLDHFRRPWVHSCEPSVVASASHLVLPGVGHGGQAMSALERSGMQDALEDAVLRRTTPVLGICLGMQLMTQFTEEGGRSCLGWFDLKTIELRPASTRLKVPNIGWHTVQSTFANGVLAGIDLPSEPFYFCHRYGVPVAHEGSVAATIEYGETYAAVLKRDNMIGVQFHPEKSQEAGLKLFQNFLRMRSGRV